MSIAAQALEELLREKDKRIAALEEGAPFRPVCAACGEPAVCLGAYEAEENVGFACDSCCGHGNEDGWCVPISHANEALQHIRESGIESGKESAQERIAALEAERDDLRVRYEANTAVMHARTTALQVAEQRADSWMEECVSMRQVLRADLGPMTQPDGLGAAEIEAVIARRDEVEQRAEEAERLLRDCADRMERARSLLRKLAPQHAEWAMLWPVEARAFLAKEQTDG